MQVCCHGNHRANRTFKKLFDFLEMLTVAPIKLLVMGNFNADFNIASVSLIGLVRCPVCYQIREIGKNHLNNSFLQLYITKKLFLL